MTSTHHRVDVAEIIRDDGLQAREKLDPQTVSDYSEIYAAGNPDSLPALIGFSDDDGKLWLADGWHRLEAAQQAGLKNLPVDVRPGGKRAATLFACGANASHGLRRSAADKRRAVSMLLADPEWGQCSDRWIADQCKVHHQLVARCRASQVDDHPPERKGRDGKSYPVQPATKPAPAQQVHDFVKPREPEPGPVEAEQPSMAAIVLDSLGQSVPDALRTAHSTSAHFQSLATQIGRIRREVDAVARCVGGEHLDLSKFQEDAEALQSQLKGAMFMTACQRCRGDSLAVKTCTRCSKSGFLPASMRGRLSADEKATLGI